MWYAAVIRFIRRRLVLGIIFVSSLTYCIVSFWKEGSARGSSYQDISIEHKPFVWRTLQETNDTIDRIVCRNSLQGKDFIVDDRGYICPRVDIMRNGCCDPDAETSKRYQCDTCKRNNCCVVYEYCVSCCLDPGKREESDSSIPRLWHLRHELARGANHLRYGTVLYPERDMLELVLSKLSAEENVLFRTLTDDYELCLAKCRTSSHSVLHENSYRDPDHKHCFGEEPPGTRSPD